MDRNKIGKMVAILAAITVIAGTLLRVTQQNSYTLGDYAEDNPSLAYQTKEPETIQPQETQARDPGSAGNSASDTGALEDQITDDVQSVATEESVSSLTGAILNKDIPSKQRYTYEDGFYYEPLSDRLQRYITGVTFPTTTVEDSGSAEITYDELRYVHILHYDFEGKPAEGELICNQAIAQDLVEIFYELYRNEYQLEKVLLMDEYDGDDIASMEDNNTSCFNYRVVEGSNSLSKHALGLALDINPLYNPYITYEKDGTEKISPAEAIPYADRTVSFPYKIDENDLCYKLFTAHGFTWGGNWNSCKDYQHFQKTIP